MRKEEYYKILDDYVYEYEDEKIAEVAQNYIDEGEVFRSGAHYASSA